MELKVRAVNDGGEKSSQQVEQELLDKHEKTLEQKDNAPVATSVQGNEETNSPATEIVAENKPEESQDLTEEQVLSHINTRYDKNIESVKNTSY